jgi:hypothetical protein
MIIKKDYIVYKNLAQSSKINLSDLNIETIDPYSLHGLSQLKSITLESNFLKSIDAATFHGIALEHNIFFDRIKFLNKSNKKV